MPKTVSPRTPSEGGIGRAGSFGSEAEDDGKTVMSVNSATAAAAATSAAPLDTASKHILNLPLEKMLEGEKYKLSLHHAQEALPKLSQDKMLKLDAHLKNVLLASKLTPANIMTTPLDEVKSAVSALSRRIQHWPTCTALSLLKRQLEEKMQQVRPCDDERKLLELWQTLSPLRAHGEDLNLMNVKLGLLDIASAEKSSIILDSVLNGVLLELVLGGEAKKSEVQWFASKVLDQVAGELMQDFEDAEIEKAYGTLQVCLGGLLVLLSASPEQKLEEQHLVERLQALQKQASAGDGMSGDPALSIALALDSTAWWSQHLVSFGVFLHAMEVHKPAMLRVCRYLEESGMEKSDAQVAELAALLPVLCTLQEELPPECMQQISQRVWDRVKAAWDAFLHPVSKDASIKSDVAHHLLVEAGLAFPMETLIEEAKEKMSQVLKAENAAEKVKNLFTQLEAVSVEKGLEHLSQEHLDRLLDAVRRAKGMVLDASLMTKLSLAWDKFAKPWESSTLDLQVSEQLLDFFEGLGTFYEGGKEKAPDLKHMRARHDLMKSWTAFHGSKKEIAEMISEDDERKKLAALMRSVQMAEKAWTSSAWASGQLQGNIEGMKSKVQEACDELMKQVWNELTTTMNGHKVAVSGSPTGELWYGGLLHNATWSAIQEKARPSLLEVDGAVFEIAITSFEEATI